MTSGSTEAKEASKIVMAWPLLGARSAKKKPMARARMVSEVMIASVLFVSFPWVLISVFK